MAGLNPIQLKKMTTWAEVEDAMTALVESKELYGETYADCLPYLEKITGLPLDAYTPTPEDFASHPQFEETYKHMCIARGRYKACVDALEQLARKNKDQLSKKKETVN